MTTPNNTPNSKTSRIKKLIAGLALAGALASGAAIATNAAPASGDISTETATLSSSWGVSWQ